MNAFLEIPDVKGSARQKHVLGKIVINGMTALVAADPNWKTGKPEKDKNKHKPMVLIKEIDRASTKLYTALKNATTYDNVRLEFWRMPPGGGTEQNYYTIKMDGVQIAGLRLLMPNNRFSINELMPEQEELMLTFTSISYSFSAGGKEGGTDSKENAVSAELKAEFEIPIETKAKAAAIDAGKDATKALAGEIYKLFKPESPKK